MDKRIRSSVGCVLGAFCLLLICQLAFANNLSITNVSLGNRNPSNNTVVVTFDIAWENSWRTKINHDAAWLTVRLFNPSVSPTDKKLCSLTMSGLNPTGTSISGDFNLELSVPSDKNGVFVRPSTFGVSSTVSATSVQVTIDYSSSGFSSSDNVQVSILGVEMVYIPQGSFYAGDYNGSTAALNEGSGDSDPWYVASENVIAVSNPASDGYRYVSGGNAGEESTGASFVISANFPKGYNSFYAMKYEVTEGQWVEFINALPAESRARHDLTDTNHKNTDLVKYRNTISCSGSPLVCSTQRPSRAINYLSWMDLAAFLDWAALRPMSELEYEKMARGAVLPKAGEFAWGSINVTAASGISTGEELGIETVTTSGANANYNNMTLSGGDTTNGADYQKGAIRGGIFATAESTRESAGAGYYGNMELSGNVAERVVTIGNVTGRSFIGSNGDGILTTVSGYEGNADQSDWPGIDVQVTRGITGATGSGFKGGSLEDQNAGEKLKISERSEAARTSTQALYTAGGRGVRSYTETW